MSGSSYLPLVAILRGVQPHECLSLGHILVDAGYQMIEVPMNSPRPLESIGLLAQEFGQDVLIGAGTVTSVEQVQAIRAVGGRLMVAPNTDAKVIRASKQAGMYTMPGCITPTEALLALETGADALKFFPAGLTPPAVITAIRTILPAGTLVCAVGGIDGSNMAAYMMAGCGGFGLGGSLFQPGISAEAFKRNAETLMNCFISLSQSQESQP
ncbi:2-dehydro-3-deoxy-6-phosphogalactonate aldolase [Bowmanella dokdonensis]|uniref:2-dehydro-3-deoxy-6-phosphogalactonate aldolase n=1 Tax=Bowmanella dokdonensis TaxID=751969 RepID=A0A939DRZ4_9ALTE|nr:2-dehydro-3-deoxy-6-phosphogalactonate aldolase [Bowmanella dokdonensis]MBN7827140.1 2-dehydro-3-deoxy-6-phosphogalactonate aldolase [Bowmanella dokdonensis]